MAHIFWMVSLVLNIFVFRSLSFPRIAIILFEAEQMDVEKR